MSTYHHGDLRAAVLTAAGKIIEKEGLAGLSVREAARSAGVSHNAPYRHFPDRQALLVALAAQGFSELDKALENRSGRELAEAYVRFALERPERFRLMFGAQLGLHAQAKATYEHVARSIAGIGGEMAHAPAAAWSLVHGLAQLLLEGHLENNEAFVRNVLSAVRFVQRSA